MVGRRHSSLACILDKESPLTALFGALLKKWALGAGENEAPKTAVCFSRAAVDLSGSDRAETGRASHEVLCTLAGRHTKGVNRLAFLTVDGYGLVSLLHFLFNVAGGKYEEGPGNIWAVKGEIQSDRILMLANVPPFTSTLTRCSGVQAIRSFRRMPLRSPLCNSGTCITPPTKSRRKRMVFQTSCAPVGLPSCRQTLLGRSWRSVRTVSLPPLTRLCDGCMYFSCARPPAR